MKTCNVKTDSKGDPRVCTLEPHAGKRHFDGHNYWHQGNAREKGEGSIYQRSSDGMYVASFSLPSHDGKRRRRTVTSKTPGGVRQKMTEEKRRLAERGDIITSGQTLASWMEVWFRDIALKRIRPKTAATYRSIMKTYIIPALGDKQLRKLTPAHVRHLHAYITDQGLSSTTALQAHRILASALKYAHREKRVDENVATLTDAPQKAVKNLTVLSLAEGIKTLRAAYTPVGDGTEPPRLASRWAAALLLGGRQGEMLGLEIDRVVSYTDDNGDTQWELDITWQLQRITWEHGCEGTCGKKRGHDCPSRKITKPANWEHRYITGAYWWARPKSEAGRRRLPLVEPLRTPLLARVDVAQTEHNPFGLVWTTPEGMPIDPKFDNYAWHDLLDSAGVTQVRLHDARHVTASLLLKAGVPRHIIIKILGHSSFVQSLDYADIDRAEIAEGMKAIGSLMPHEN